MAYDPYKPNERERSKLYLLNWFGCAASICFVVDYFILAPLVLSKFLLVITSALLGSSLFSPRFDDYYRSLRNEGSRWASGLLALSLLASSILSLGDLGYELGLTAVSGDLDDLGNVDIVMLFGADLTIRLACVAFFAGFTYKHLRS